MRGRRVEAHFWRALLSCLDVSGLPLLRFKLEQLHLQSLERWFLPLPKLGKGSLSVLSEHLEKGGFGVRRGGGQAKLLATKGSMRISVDGKLGLASSGGDMLDVVGPAIPKLIETGGRETISGPMDVSSLYFSVRRSRGLTRLQVFPRLESLRTWTSLRGEGLCGLTPDEAAALKSALGGADPAGTVACVTASPRDGSSPFQVGAKVYFRSELPLGEFLSSLRVMGSGGSDSSFLPRDSVVEVRGTPVQGRAAAAELGEWCLVRPASER